MVRRPSSSVRRPSVVHNVQTSSFPETAWPIKAKFYVEPPWVGGTIFCSRHLGRMTKMVAMPIYGKTLQKSSSPEAASDLKVVMSRHLIEYMKVCEY